MFTDFTMLAAWSLTHGRTDARLKSKVILWEAKGCLVSDPSPSSNVN